MVVETFLWPMVNRAGGPKPVPPRPTVVGYLYLLRCGKFYLSPDGPFLVGDFQRGVYSN